MPVDLLGEREMVQNAVPLPRLTHSAKQYARMVNAGMPCTPVNNGVERRKFASEVDDNIFIPGDQMGRFQKHQGINFDKWAVEWNNHCAKIESGRVEWEAVYRKTSKQLQAYFDRYRERANVKVTMMPIRQPHAALRTNLQEPAGGAGFAGLVGNIVPPPAPRSRSGAGIGGSEEWGAAGGEGVPAGVEEMLDFGGGGYVEVDATQPKPNKAKGPPRGPQHCFQCGHRKKEGAYKEAHPPPREKVGRPPCNVPPGEYRPEACRIGKPRQDGMRAWRRCSCEKCTAGSTALIVA